jgi:hypothetical protein
LRSREVVNASAEITEFLGANSSEGCREPKKNDIALPLVSRKSDVVKH